MASPFKRICLQASQQRICARPSLYQWQHLRAIHSSTARSRAEEIQPATDSTPEASDAMLDELTKQPGVKYTTTEESEDFSRVGLEGISSLAYRELEQHKEMREMVRIAAWEMPLLSQFAKEFNRPSRDEVLKWRYTTYMGEPHPAARKVVVEFRPGSLRDLDEEQRLKLIKLAGVRYNPSTRTVKMSCESFETQAQNKRYLADTIAALIAEAKDLESDSFADVPLDFRHHKPKKQPKFPKAWIMTEERKAELEKKRNTQLLEEGGRVERKEIVSGWAAIDAKEQADREKAARPIVAAAKQPLPQGKMGKKEMGQKGRR